MAHQLWPKRGVGLAGKERSCLKKLLVGCGCLSGLALIIGVSIAIFVASAKPKPPEFDQKTFQQQFESTELEGLFLPELPPEALPLRVQIDVSNANLIILPSDELGLVRTESDYDTANFILETEMLDQGGMPTYRIVFKNKRSYSMFLGGNKENRNKVIVYLPTDLAIALDVKFSIGVMDMDLTGIPMVACDLDVSMGEVTWVTRSMNPIPMEKMSFTASMGEFELTGVEHWRASKALFDISMGETYVRLKGPLERDLNMQIEASMGEYKIELPKATRIDSKVDVSMGEYRGPRASPESEAGHWLKIRGSLSMGNLEVNRRD